MIQMSGTIVDGLLSTGPACELNVQCYCSFGDVWEVVLGIIGVCVCLLFSALSINVGICNGG